MEDKCYSQYLKYKSKYILLKKQLGGIQQQFGYDNPQVKKLRKQINLINIILYSQFSYLKREDYINYCLRNIWHYINYIPGKYFTNKLNIINGINLTNDNRLVVLLHDKDKVIIGWKLPDEQRDHDYQLKVTTTTICSSIPYSTKTTNIMYEIDFTNNKKTPNYYLLKPTEFYGCKIYISKIELFKKQPELTLIDTLNLEPNETEALNEPELVESNSIDKLINDIDNLLSKKKDDFNANLNIRLKTENGNNFLEDNKPKYITLESYKKNDSILEINKYIDLFNFNEQEKNEFLQLFYLVLFAFTKKIEFNDDHKKFKEINNLEYTLPKISSRMTLLEFINEYDIIKDLTKSINHISIPEFTSYKDIALGDGSAASGDGSAASGDGSAASGDGSAASGTYIESIKTALRQAGLDLNGGSIIPSSDPKSFLFQQTSKTIFFPEDGRTDKELKTKLSDAQKDNFYRKFCYFYDHMSNAIVVSIAGTDNLNDWIKNFNSNMSILYTGDGTEDEYSDFNKTEPTDNDTEIDTNSFSNIKNFNGYNNFPLLLTHQGFTDFARNIFKEICVKGISNDYLTVEDTSSGELFYKENFSKFVSNKLRKNYNKEYPEEIEMPLLKFYNDIKKKLDEDKKDSLQIIFTGHSLGSATALCLYLLCYFDKKYRELRGIMKFIGLSSPRLNHIYTSRNFKKNVNESKIFHIYHTKDLVPLTPHMSSGTATKSFLSSGNIIACVGSLVGGITGLLGSTAMGAASGGVGFVTTPTTVAIGSAAGCAAAQMIAQSVGVEDYSEETRINNAKASIWYHGGNIMKIDTETDFTDPKVNYYSSNNSILINANELAKNNFNLITSIKTDTIKFHLLSNIIPSLSETIMTEPEIFEEELTLRDFYNTLINVETKDEPINFSIDQLGGKIVSDNFIIQEKPIKLIFPKNSKMEENIEFIKFLDRNIKKYNITESINNYIISNNEKDLVPVKTFIKNIGLNKPENVVLYLEKLIEILGDNVPINLVYTIIDLKMKIKKQHYTDQNLK